MEKKKKFPQFQGKIKKPKEKWQYVNKWATGPSLYLHRDPGFNTEASYCAPRSCYIIDHKVKIKGENKGFKLSVGMSENCLKLDGKKVKDGEMTVVESEILMRGPKMLLYGDNEELQDIQNHKSKKP